MKSRVPLLVAIPVIAIGAYLGLSLIMLFLGTKNFNETSHQYNDADTIARAFSDYPKSHDGRYPRFRNAEEVTRILEPLLSKAADRMNDEGHHYVTLNSLETTARTAKWNKSLSDQMVGQMQEPSLTWIFYFPAYHSSNRFVVGYSDGKFTNKDKSELNDIFQPELKK